MEFYLIAAGILIILLIICFASYVELKSFRDDVVNYVSHRDSGRKD